MPTPKLTYSEQLRHPMWQRKRLERMQVADFQCEECQSRERTLNVHHKRYVKGRMAWEYTDHELAVLCEQCHEFEHDLKERCDEYVMQLTPGRAGPLLDGVLNMIKAGLDSPDAAPLGDRKYPNPQSDRDYFVGMVAALLMVKCEQSDIVLGFAASLLNESGFAELGERLFDLADTPETLRNLDWRQAKGKDETR